MDRKVGQVVGVQDDELLVDGPGGAGQCGVGASVGGDRAVPDQVDGGEVAVADLGGGSDYDTGW